MVTETGLYKESIRVFFFFFFFFPWNSGFFWIFFFWLVLLFCYCVTVLPHEEGRGSVSGPFYVLYVQKVSGTHITRLAAGAYGQ